MKNLKQLMIAVLAALMLAGALSAISSVTFVTSLGSVPIAGDGVSPFPLVLSSAPANDSPSLGEQF